MEAGKNVVLVKKSALPLGWWREVLQKAAFLETPVNSGSKPLSFPFFLGRFPQEWSPSHNLKSLRKKQLAAREAMARQTVVSDTEVSSVESSVIRYPSLLLVEFCAPTILVFPPSAIFLTKRRFWNWLLSTEQAKQLYGPLFSFHMWDFGVLWCPCFSQVCLWQSIGYLVL